MEKKYPIALMQKPLDEGLSQDEINQLLAKVDDDEFMPIEFDSEGAVAMGFVSIETAEEIGYIFDDIEEFIKGILDDTSKETENCEYTCKLNSRDLGGSIIALPKPITIYMTY